MTSLYVHVPFCTVRCGYCDFNTYTLNRAGISYDDYLTALAHELERAATTFGSGTVLDTVFCGGGTPTLLGAGLGQVLELIRQHFTLAPDAEVSTEANPETLTPALLQVLRGAGYNRISIGMQSANPQVLHTLGRVHTPGRAVAAVQEAKAAGFDNINLDLIYGTPGESLGEWLDSLGAALETQPTHLSAYALTLAPHTPLARRIARGSTPAITEDDLADKYLAAEALLASAGFSNYEVSNWALPARECRHNLAYWLGANWWGAGPGAHSHRADTRWWNVRNPRRWADLLAAGKSPSAGVETLNAAAQATEQVMLRLRLASGLPLQLLPASTADLVAGYVSDNLARVNGDSLVLTPTGRLLADRISLELVSN
ncbi:MAG: radical SAM family heme chaperone HemW [Propionibacteriaceae bacterium]|nr:radical SAM family heme chaperone HemW [Propionibacteriaceae bacterium]